MIRKHPGMSLFIVERGPLLSEGRYFWGSLVLGFLYQPLKIDVTIGGLLLTGIVTIGGHYV